MDAVPVRFTRPQFTGNQITGNQFTGNRIRTVDFGPVPDRALPPASRAAVLFVGVAAFAFYTIESVLRQQQFKTSLDITIFQQAIANYAGGRAPNVLIKSQEPFNILGDHFSPIVAVIAPFYRIWPSVLTLLVVQALFLAVGVHVVTRVAVRRLGGLGYYIGISFALSWGVLKVIDFDFHEACFAVAFLALALEALIDDRPGRMLAWSAALLLVKEDTPLFIAGIALVFAANRQWRWAGGLMAAAVTAFALLTVTVIPFFSSSGSYTYFNTTHAGSTGTSLPSSLFDAAVANLHSVSGLALLGALAVTAAFGLRSPLILVMVPTLLARFASDRAVYLEMKYYYDAPLMVICFLALILAVQQRRLRLGMTAERIRVWWSSAAGLAAVVGLALLLDINVQSTEIPEVFAAAGLPCQWCSDADRLIDRLPPGATVISDVSLLGHLADRNPVMLATPNWEDPGHLPLRADWVILYLDSDSYGPDVGWVERRRQTLLTEGFQQTDQEGSLVLLHREP